MSVTQVAGPYIKDNAVNGTKIAMSSDARGDVLVYDGTNYVRLGADNGKFLRSNGTGSNPSWETAGGASINSATENELVTVANNTSNLDAEANLTFDGTGQFAFANSASGSSTDFKVYSSATSGATPARVILRTAAGNTADTFISFHGVDSYEYSIGVDNSDSDKFKISGSALGTNDKFILTTDGYFDLYKSGGGTTSNGHFRLHHSGTNHGLTTLPQTDHMSSAQAVTTDTYFSVQPGWYTANGGSAIMKSFSHGNTGFYLTSWVGTDWTTQADNQGAACQIVMRPHNVSNANRTISQSANIVTMGYYDGSTSARRFFFRADGTGYADDSWTTFSDNRLKFNQEVVPYGLDTIMQLQPKVYDKYSGGIEDGVVTLSTTSKRQIGFVAQEIKAIIPEIVPFNADENNGWYSLEDGKLMAVVVKAIQELNAKVEALS